MFRKINKQNIRFKICMAAGISYLLFEQYLDNLHRIKLNELYKELDKQSDKWK